MPALSSKRGKVIFITSTLICFYLLFKWVENEDDLRIPVPKIRQNSSLASGWQSRNRKASPQASSLNSHHKDEGNLAKSSLFHRPGNGARESQFFFLGGESDWPETGVEEDGMPRTKVVVHVPGWTVLDNLYLFNGTMYIVTDDPNSIPDRKHLTSAGVLGTAPANEKLPTDAHMQVISTDKAKHLFGVYAGWLDGTSFIVTDSHQFVHHYFHWCAEVFFGLWRTYSLLDPNIDALGHTSLPSPRRLILPHITPEKFRDYASLVTYFTHAVFPALSFEFQQQWTDRSSMIRPFLLERVVLGDREAAMYSPEVSKSRRTTLSLFNENLQWKASPHWWNTIRNNFVNFAGYDPSKELVWPGEGKVITYISRQTWNRRKLRNEDHEKLVKALARLEEEYGYEVNVVSMEKLTKEEQIKLAARTTIMMGVHGNGLTALLWMKLSKRTTVMEFFYPKGFAHDYEYTARFLGIKHYGFWGDRYFTAPELPSRNYPQGFQGNEIPIDGELVARLCHERLSLPED